MDEFAWPKEVEELARMRCDRQYGAGTFDDMIAKGSQPFGRRYGEMLRADCMQAQRDLMDVAALLGGFDLPDDASPWAKRTLSRT